MRVAGHLAVVAAATLILADAWDDLAGNRWWVAPLVVAIAAALPIAIARVAACTPPGTVTLALLGAAAASYACVPETDQFPTAVVPVVVTGLVELAGRRHAARLWHCAVALLVLWAGVYGATGRPSALVGTLFAWWPLAAAALFVRPRAPRWAGPAIVVIGALAAGLVARTGGVADTVTPALVAVAVAAPLSTLLIILCQRS